FYGSGPPERPSQSLSSAISVYRTRVAPSACALAFKDRWFTIDIGNTGKVRRALPRVRLSRTSPLGGKGPEHGARLLHASRGGAGTGSAARRIETDGAAEPDSLVPGPRDVAFPRAGQQGAGAAARRGQRNGAGARGSAAKPAAESGRPQARAASPRPQAAGHPRHAEVRPAQPAQIPRREVAQAARARGFRL